MMTSSGRKPGVSANLEVLFIGGILPRDEEAQVIALTRGSVDLAANALQWSLVSGLDRTLAIPVTVLNGVFVRTFPRYYRRAWVRPRRWSHAPNCQDESVGFINIFGLKHVWRGLAMARRARQWAAGRVHATKAIVVYSMHTPFVIAAAVAKRINPLVKICLMVPDLPEYMHVSGARSRLWALLKQVDQWVMSYFIKDVDCFVLLTKHMAGRLPVGDRPWVVVEGMVNPEEVAIAPPAPTRGGEKVVLYTGTLAKAYGVLELLQAFEAISDPDYRLWLCGAGEAEPEIRRMAERDPRIRWFGQISRSEVLALQRRATVLVNPRTANDEFTRYSFPSKVMEYMLSGTPTVVRKLPGIPEQYYEYLVVTEGSLVSGLRDAIVRVCSMSPDERARLGARAQQFVLRTKSNGDQAALIVDLILRARGGLCER